MIHSNWFDVPAPAMLSAACHLLPHGATVQITPQQALVYYHRAIGLKNDLALAQRKRDSKERNPTEISWAHEFDIFYEVRGNKARVFFVYYFIGRQLMRLGPATVGGFHANRRQ